MTPALVAAGRALYGPRWQAELARALGVGDRSMRRYAAGERPLPTALYPRLRQLIRTRVNALVEARLAIDEEDEG